MIPCHPCHLTVVDKLDTHLPGWKRSSKSAKQSLPWTGFSRDPVEARGVVEISQREGEASGRSMEGGGRTCRKEAYLRDIARVVFTEMGEGGRGVFINSRG